MAATRRCPDQVGYIVASLFSAVLAIVFIVGIVRYHANIAAYMRYFVSIDSASGLDLPPSKDLALDLQFNLTVRLASSRPGRRPVCMDAGTYLLVSHRCVPLATSAAAPHQLCVGGTENSWVSMHVVVAKGTSVRLPGYVMDSLVADLRSGVEVFEVRFKMSGNNFRDLASCGFRRVGDVAAECGPWLICRPPQPGQDNECSGLHSCSDNYTARRIILKFNKDAMNIQSAQRHPLTRHALKT